MCNVFPLPIPLISRFCRSTISRKRYAKVYPQCINISWTVSNSFGSTIVQVLYAEYLGPLLLITKSVSQKFPFATKRALYIYLCLINNLFSALTLLLHCVHAHRRRTVFTTNIAHVYTHNNKEKILFENVLKQTASNTTAHNTIQEHCSCTSISNEKHKHAENRNSRTKGRNNEKWNNS